MKISPRHHLGPFETTGSIYSRRRRNFAACIGLAAVTLALTGPASRADTDHIREFAKNTTPVLIVVSGPDAEPIGRRLEQAIERSGDFKNRSRDSVQVVSVADAERAIVSKQFSHASIVFLLAGTDPGANSPTALPSALAALIPLKPEIVGGRMTMVRSGKDGADPGSPAFRVGLYAPDSERLQKIYDIFAQHRVRNFRELPFVDAYRTNRVYVHSAPEYQALLTSGWGQMNDEHVWNDIRWSPVEDLPSFPPSSVPEGTRVYFVDRKSVQTLPPTVLSALDGRPGAKMPCWPFTRTRHRMRRVHRRSARRRRSDSTISMSSIRRRDSFSRHEFEITQRSSA